MRLTVPVVPDADQAREWARDELAKTEYSDQGTSWFEMFLDWVNELFGALDGVGGSLSLAWTIIIVLLVVAIVAIVIWLILGPLRRSRRSKGRTGMLDDDARSSEQMRDAALAAEAAGDWDTAAMEWYRASVRSMEERGRISDSPGATAREAAGLLAKAAPGIANEAAQSALSFDIARYGSGGLGEPEAAQARATYDAFIHARGVARGESRTKEHA